MWARWFLGLLGGLGQGSKIISALCFNLLTYLKKRLMKALIDTFRNDKPSNL